MEDYSGKITFREKEYKLVFNLNVMERIQSEYGSVQKWGEMTNGSGGEPNVKAVIFGFTEMLNEGIDINNEENGAADKPLTLKQVGRMITEIGFKEATKKLQDTVIESTESEQKNA